MDFPDQGLVQLAPRDLTGPGVEFYARRITGSGIAQSISATLTQDQLNIERIYMLTWSWSAIPNAAVRYARSVRWYLQLPAIDLQIYGQTFDGVDGTAVSHPRFDRNSPFLVIPGGKGMLFVADFDQAGVAAHTLDGWIWGYSFPKGNVLSF